MSFLPASRTRRNLFKVATLGLAGLLAGLLAGCNDSPDTTVNAPYTSLSSEFLSPDTAVPAEPTPLPSSIDATQIPALHHQPTSRFLESESIHTVSMTTAPSSRSRS
ncbi:MAG: hypothetical protein ACRD3K_06515 [Edaphobacter sp.]